MPVGFSFSLVSSPSSADTSPAGYGDSDPGWATFFELVAKQLEQALGPEVSCVGPKEFVEKLLTRSCLLWKDREYYTSDAKLGVKDGWKKLTSAEPGKLSLHTNLLRHPLPYPNFSDKRFQDANVLLTPSASLLERSKASVLALEALLRVTPFLTGDAPGFVDYIAYGRYAMMANLDPKLTDEVWHDRKTSELKEWIARIEARFAGELKEVLGRTPKL